MYTRKTLWLVSVPPYIQSHGKILITIKMLFLGYNILLVLLKQGKERERERERDLSCTTFFHFKKIASANDYKYKKMTFLYVHKIY
jgi:hypothetical protein